MFTTTLRPRALPRTLPALSRPYTRAAHPHIPTTPLRTLLRSSTLRASSTVAQRAYTLSSAPLQSSTHSRVRDTQARTPSPPPPYTVRGVSVQASERWTRFSTSTSLSSVRTFSSASRKSAAHDGAAAGEVSGEAKMAVDEVVETITEMFATAKDEFEIAAEETIKNTTYAEDDRAAAREELDKLLEYYGQVLDRGGVVGEEVKRRVGHRIRELEQAVIAMEEAALEHD